MRSIVLDGVAPAEMAIGADFARDGQRAIDLMFKRCAANADCNAAFPNLQADFTALLDRLEAGPVEVQLDDPFTLTLVAIRLFERGASIDSHRALRRTDRQHLQGDKIMSCLSLDKARLHFTVRRTERRKKKDKQESFLFA